MAIWDHFKQKGEEEWYKVERNRAVDMIDKAKTDYYSTMINANKNNSKKLWRYMNEIAPKEKKQLGELGKKCVHEKIKISL